MDDKFSCEMIIEESIHPYVIIKSLSYTKITMLLMAPSSTKIRMMKLITQNFNKYEDHDVINDKPIFVVYRDYQEEAPVFYEHPHRV